MWRIQLNPGFRLDTAIFRKKSNIFEYVRYLFKGLFRLDTPTQTTPLALYKTQDALHSLSPTCIVAPPKRLALSGHHYT